SSTTAQVELEPPDGGLDTFSKNANYQPNLRGGFGIGISYRAIDVSLGLRQKLDPATEAIYGKTSYASFSFRLWATRHVLFEFAYNKISGFANISSPTYDTIRTGSETPFVHRPDIDLRYIKLRGVYQFNPHKFSYRSAF